MNSFLPPFLCAALVLGALLPGQAQTSSEREKLADNILLPQRRTIRLHPVADSRPVEITNAAVTVKINGSHAETIWKLTVKNPSNRRQEAVLTLPVPENALLKAFSYAIPGKAGQAPSVFPARLMSATEARQLYDSIVARALDPALLEFAGYGVIRSSVFPVEAQSSVQLTVTYEQLLKAQSGKYEYVLPRTEAVQQSDWSLEMEIAVDSPEASTTESPPNASAQLFNIYSPTHELITKRLRNGHASIRLAKDAANQSGNFRLYWEAPDAKKPAPGVSLFSCPAGTKKSEGYFMIIWEPEKAAKPKPRELTLVLDRSGSMRGEKLEKVKAAARSIVQSLNEKEYFNLITYNEGVDCFSDKPVAKSAESEKAALAWIDSIRPRGGTNIHEALKTALAQPAQADLFPLVLFLTDGLPTIGETKEKAILSLTETANPAQRRVFTLGVGTDVNAPLLRKIGEISRAESLFILPGEDVAEKVVLLEKSLQEPLVTNPQLMVCDSSGNPTPGRVRDVIPSPLPDVFGGGQMIVAGQYFGDEPIHFVLKGKEGDRDISHSFVFTQPEADDFVPRLWAARKIGILQNALWDKGIGTETAAPDTKESREIIDEIVRLSIEFGIMTEFTSFFADDGSSSSFQRNTRTGRESRRFTHSFQQRKEEMVDLVLSEERAGEAAISKNSKAVQLAKQSVLNKKNKQPVSKGTPPQLSSLRQIGKDSFYLQGQVWVEQTLLAKDGENYALKQKHDRIISPNTPEYKSLIDQLTQEQRLGILSLEENVNFRLGNEFIFLKNK